MKLIKRKYLEIKEIPSKNSEYVTIKIIKQTHRRNSFGIRGSGYEYKNKIKLYSDSYPEWRPGTIDDTSMLFVKGSDTSFDNKHLQIPNDKYIQIKKAIESYNNYFSGKEIY